MIMNASYFSHLLLKTCIKSECNKTIDNLSVHVSLWWPRQVPKHDVLVQPLCKKTNPKTSERHGSSKTFVLFPLLHKIHIKYINQVNNDIPNNIVPLHIYTWVFLHTTINKYIIHVTYVYKGLNIPSNHKYGYIIV